MTRRGSLRNLERRLDALETEGPHGGDYPIVSLATLIAALEDDAVELVDEEHRLYRVNGHLREIPQKTLDLFDTLAEGEGSS